MSRLLVSGTPLVHARCGPPDVSRNTAVGAVDGIGMASPLSLRFVADADDIRVVVRCPGCLLPARVSVFDVAHDCDGCGHEFWLEPLDWLEAPAGVA